jgi:MFS family permease
VAAGAVVSGLSLVLLGRVSEVWHVYLAYALFGAGFAASSLIPGTTLVTRWFARRRSVALSVASTGLSAGGVLITPLMATLVRDEGLSTVAPYLGLALVLGVVPLTAWLLRPSPQALGLQPDGDPLPPPGSPAGYLGDEVVEVGDAADRRDAGLAATALSLLAASSLVGRLLGGVVATAVSMRGLTVVLMVAQGLALVALAAVQSPVVLLVTTVAFGLTVGNLLMLHPLLLAERFGVRDYAHIYSRSQLVATFGVALGPAFIGTLHDVVDGYGIAFAVAGAASVVGAVVLSVSGPMRVDAHVLEEAA